MPVPVAAPVTPPSASVPMKQPCTREPLDPDVRFTPVLPLPSSLIATPRKVSGAVTENFEMLLPMLTASMTMRICALVAPSVRVLRAAPGCV